MNKIPRDSWAIIERVIRRYPETKEEYAHTIQELIGGTGRKDGQPGGGGVGNPTESAAIQLHTPRMERMRREIEAVEMVYSSLPPEHQKVIRIRFWSDRYRNMPYRWMRRSVSYEEAQMKRIIGRFVRRVGERLGEIER